MKKLILATVSVFGLSVLGSAAQACDGMKSQAKGDKSDQSDHSTAAVKKDAKTTKADQKS